MIRELPPRNPVFAGHSAAWIDGYTAAVRGRSCSRAPITANPCGEKHPNKLDRPCSACSRAVLEWRDGWRTGHLERARRVRDGETCAKGPGEEVWAWSLVRKTALRRAG